jgi:hypothetical protein
MPSKELVDIAVELRHETLKAYLIYDGEVEVWVPKSLVEIERAPDSNVVVATMPEWLAKKLELI